MVSPLKVLSRLIIILVVSCQFLAVRSFGQGPDYIRVAILQDAPAFNLKINGAYEIEDSVSKKVLTRGRNLKATITAYKKGIFLGNFAFPAHKIMIKVSTEPIVIDGRKFRGNIQFSKKDNARLAVINYIELEDYIRGVLYNEASHYWPLEALKAQAVASRTFALYQMQENAAKDYDLTSDVYSQVYGGRMSERYRTNLAVEQTEGEVLKYQGRLFPAYYHATCAGHTEDASLLWNIDLAPLKGVSCGFCKDSPHFRWHYILTKDELKEALAKAGYHLKTIQDILILEKDASGRVKKLKIVSQEESLVILAKDLRNIIGPSIIRSTNFSLRVAGGDAVFEGFGWGHGVGLCQWGAYFMAKGGYSYTDILKYYYPGSKISSIIK